MPGVRGWKPETPSESQGEPAPSEEIPSESTAPTTEPESSQKMPTEEESSETEALTEPTKDRYQTDPIPEDKPKPVEPEVATVDTTTIR